MGREKYWKGGEKGRYGLSKVIRCLCKPHVTTKKNLQQINLVKKEDIRRRIQ